MKLGLSQIFLANLWFFFPKRKFEMKKIHQLYLLKWRNNSKFISSKYIFASVCNLFLKKSFNYKLLLIDSKKKRFKQVHFFCSISVKQTFFKHIQRLNILSPTKTAFFDEISYGAKAWVIFWLLSYYVIHGIDVNMHDGFHLSSGKKWLPKQYNKRIFRRLL